jgi:hypothetical protein
MEREQRPSSNRDEAPEPVAVRPAPAEPAASPPASTSAAGDSRGGSAGAWHASDSLMSAMGLGPTSAAPTLYRSVDPSATPTRDPGPVDAALGTAGSGDSHASGARFHTDGAAAAAASSLGAAAFTAGSDVYFGAGQYNPGTPSGDALIHHELAHVEQTRGLDAPGPGNYRVSDPSDAAEVAARGAEQGGAAGGGAEAGTIHRSLLGDIGTAIVDTAMSVTGADKLEEFLNALAVRDVAGAQSKWGSVNGLMRATMRTSSAIMNVVGHYPGGLKADPIESVIDVMGKDGLPVMKDVGVAFDRVSYVDAVLDGAGHDAAYWMPELKSQAVFDAWLQRMPARAALGEARLTKLGPYMDLATDIADARKIFEQAYPRLRDDAYDATIVKVAAWGTDDVKRMWSSLRGQLPLAHVQTITGGFNLGTDEDLKKDGTFAPLRFGWHHPGPEVIVMPKNSSTAGEGGTGHNMTGGSGSGRPPTGAAGDPALTHWDGTMLHEIGHGVGSKTDGNTFAQSHGDWQGQQSWDTWSQNLFDDTAATAALPTPAPTPVLPAAEARQFLAKEVGGTAYLPPKWPNRDDVVAFINAHYAAQKLVGYWSAVKAGTAEYIVTPNNHSGDRTYVWLSRGGLDYTSYKKEISDNKVSWYGISSTVEWFAEQYANYYRTGKAATGADATTKAKLDAIDKMDATSTGGLSAPPAPGTPATPDPSGAGDGGTVVAENRSVEAEIHRMNF